MNAVILVYLLFNSLAFVMGQELRSQQEFFFQISSLALILSSLVFQPKQKKESMFENKFNISLFAMFAWFMFIFLRDKMGWSVLLNTFLGIGVYLTTIRNIDYSDVKFIIKNSLWIVVFVISYLAFQFVGFDFRGQSILNAPGVVPKCSVFGLEAHYGMYLAMIFPLLLGISFINDVNFVYPNPAKTMAVNVLKMLPILGLIALMFIALFPAHSTGAYLGLLVAVLVYLWHRRRTTFWVAIIPVLGAVIAFIMLIDNPMGMQKSRLDMWAKVTQDSHKNPFGRGLDSFRIDDREGAMRYFKYAFNDTTVRVKKTGQDWLMQVPPDQQLLDNIEATKKGISVGTLNYWDNCHNFYIQLLYEEGFPAMIILGFILFFLYKIFRFSMKRPLTVACYCSILVVLVGSVVQFPLYVARLGHVIPIIAGMFIVSARDEV